MSRDLRTMNSAGGHLADRRRSGSGRPRAATVVLGTLLLLPPFMARADEATAQLEAAKVLPRESRGLTGSIGLGLMYGGIGGQVRFDFPIRPWLHLAPFVGAGFLPKNTPNDRISDVFFNVAGGIAAGLGRRHRFALDMAVGPTAFQDLNLHGTVVDTRSLYGPTIDVGYEHVMDDGRFQRFTIGFGRTMWRTTSSDSSVSFNLNFGFGGRLW